MKEKIDIVSYLPLVVALAQRLSWKLPRSVELDDLIQDGSLGLIDAARRFDNTKQVSFGAFARLRINGAMMDGLRRFSPPRVTRGHKQQLQAKLEEHPEATVAELAEHLQLTVEGLKHTYQRIQLVESLAHKDGVPLGFIPSPRLSPFEQYAQREEELRLRDAVSRLSRREQQIVQRYYYEELTQKEIAQQLDVGQPWVSQLHLQLIKALRQQLKDTKE